MSVTLELPSFPPKQRPKFKRKDETVLAYTTQDYSDLRQAVAEQWAGAPLTGRVGLEMDYRVALPAGASKATRARMLAGEITPGSKKCDKLLQALMGALNGVVVKDERQFALVTGRVSYGVEPGVSVAVGNVVFPFVPA